MKIYILCRAFGGGRLIFRHCAKRTCATVYCCGLESRLWKKKTTAKKKKKKITYYVEFTDVHLYTKYIIQQSILSEHSGYVNVLFYYVVISVSFCGLYVSEKEP